MLCFHIHLNDRVTEKCLCFHIHLNDRVTEKYSQDILNIFNPSVVLLIIQKRISKKKMLVQSRTLRIIWFSSVILEMDSSGEIGIPSVNILSPPNAGAEQIQVPFSQSGLRFCSRPSIRQPQSEIQIRVRKSPIKADISDFFTAHIFHSPFVNVLPQYRNQKKGTG